MRAFVAIGFVGGVALLACGGGIPTPTDPTVSATTASSGRGPVTHIECGDHYTCAVLKDGSLSCWGTDRDGQLGDGGGEDRPKPTKVPGLSGVRRIALASTHGCALGTDRSVRCWGSGRVPGGKTLARAAPAPIPNLTVEDISGSGVLMCAKLEGGKVQCWGSEKNADPDVGPGKIADVAVAATHGCARKEDGTVQCWNAEHWGGVGTDVLNRPALPSPAVDIGTGDAFACVVGKDKQVYCWGSNDLGQLGKTPDYLAHDQPEAVPGVRDAESVAIGEASACALLTGGRVTCWGANASGELGLDTPHEALLHARDLGALLRIAARHGNGRGFTVHVHGHRFGAKP